MGVLLGRPGGIPLTKTVWTQGEVFFNSGIGRTDIRMVSLRIPKELVHRKIYVALGCTHTGTIIPDAATNNVDDEFIGDLDISLEGSKTFSMRHYHNPQPTNLAATEDENGRSVGPWPPCGLSLPITLANVVPKLPQPTHPDCRYFTMLPRRADSAGPLVFLPLIATCYPMRNVSEGNLLEFQLTVNRNSTAAGTIRGHLIVAVESSSHAI